MYNFAKPLIYKSKSDVYRIGRFEILTFLWIRFSVFLGALTFFIGSLVSVYYYYTETSKDYWGYSQSSVMSTEKELIRTNELFNKQLNKLKWANSQIRPAHILDVLSIIEVPMVERLQSGILGEESSSKIIVSDGDEGLTEEDQLKNIVTRGRLYPSYQLKSFELFQDFPNRKKSKSNRYSSKSKVVQPPIIVYGMKFKWLFDSKSAVRSLPEVSKVTALMMRPDFDGDVFNPWISDFKYNQSSGVTEGVYRFGLDAEGIIKSSNNSLFSIQKDRTIKDMLNSYSSFYSNIQEAVSGISKK